MPAPTNIPPILAGIANHIAQGSGLDRKKINGPMTKSRFSAIK
jgi:hypothetical protein